MSGDTILKVSDLRVEFAGRRSSTAAVRDVSFSLGTGKTLALVGESGSGKSVTSLAIMGLLPRAGRIARGTVRYRGRDGEAVDLYRFTSILMNTMSASDRIGFIEILWEMVYADGVRHELEDNVVWRISELLGVSGRDRVLMRQRVQERLGIEGGDEG